jgi:hypothetical protein
MKRIIPIVGLGLGAGTSAAIAMIAVAAMIFAGIRSSGLGPAGIFSKHSARTLAIMRRRRARHELAAISFVQKMIGWRQSQQHHCSVCAGLSAQRERVW